MLIFRTLLAPFARGLSPRGWVVPLILGGLAAAQAFQRNRQQSQYRSEVDEARRQRGELFAALAPRLAGVEGVSPNILRAAGQGLPPAPAQGGTNLFERALQIAGAYHDQRQQEQQQPAEGGGGAPAEGAPPPAGGEPAQMGGLTQQQGDPASQAADQAVQAGGGEPAQMGGLTQQQPPPAEASGEDAAAQQTAVMRDFFNPIDAMGLA